MKPCFIMAIVLLASFVGPAKGKGDEESLKKRFLSEYPNAMKAWEARCSKMEATVKYTEDNLGKPHREVLYSFKCNLPEMVLTSISTEPGGQREESVSGTNTDYTFSLKRRGSDTDFALKSMEAANGSDRAKRNSPARFIRPIAWVPYAARYSNADLFAQPRFTIRGISTLSRDGKSLVRVEFDLPGEPLTEAKKNTYSDPGHFEGYFLVSPEEKWVLYEYECRETRAGRRQVSYKGTVEYQGTADGFPIPKRAARQTAKLGGGDPIERYTDEFLEFRFADVPHREFTVSAFGIPEAVSQPAKPANSRGVGYWLVSLALAAMAAAVLFKVAASRRKASSPS